MISYYIFSYFESKLKNIVSRFYINSGRYCFNCGEDAIPPEDFFKKWSNHISSTGKLDFFSKENPTLCKRCERDHKLALITRKVPIDKISLKKNLILYDKKISIGVVSIYLLMALVEVIYIFIGLDKTIQNNLYLAVDIYAILFWLFFVIRDRIFIFKKD